MKFALIFILFSSVLSDYMEMKVDYTCSKNEKHPKISDVSISITIESQKTVTNLNQSKSIYNSTENLGLNTQYLAECQEDFEIIVLDSKNDQKTQAKIYQGVQGTIQLVPQEYTNRFNFFELKKQKNFQLTLKENNDEEEQIEIEKELEEEKQKQSEQTAIGSQDENNENKKHFMI